MFKVCICRKDYSKNTACNSIAFVFFNTDKYVCTTDFDYKNNFKLVF